MTFHHHLSYLFGICCWRCWHWGWIRWICPCLDLQYPCCCRRSCLLASPYTGGCHSPWNHLDSRTFLVPSHPFRQIFHQIFHQHRFILSHLDLRLAASNLLVSSLCSFLWTSLYPFPFHAGQHLVLHPAGDFWESFPFHPFWTELS